MVKITPVEPQTVTTAIATKLMGIVIIPSTVDLKHIFRMFLFSLLHNWRGKCLAKVLEL